MLPTAPPTSKCHVTFPKYTRGIQQLQGPATLHREKIHRDGSLLCSSELTGQIGTRLQWWREIARIRIGHLGKGRVSLQIQSLIWPELHSLDLAEEDYITLRFAAALIFLGKTSFLQSLQLLE